MATPARQVPRDSSLDLASADYDSATSAPLPGSRSRGRVGGDCCCSSGPGASLPGAALGGAGWRGDGGGGGGGGGGGASFPGAEDAP